MFSFVKAFVSFIGRFVMKKREKSRKTVTLNNAEKFLMNCWPSLQPLLSSAVPTHSRVASSPTNDDLDRVGALPLASASYVQNDKWSLQKVEAILCFYSFIMQYVCILARCACLNTWQRSAQGLGHSNPKMRLIVLCFAEEKSGH